MAYQPLELNSLAHDLPKLKGAWNLFYYIPSLKYTEPFSVAISQFKEGNAHHAQKLTSLAIQALKNTGIQFDFVVRPLGSSEIKVAKTKALDHLGDSISNQLGAYYLPSLFEKTKAIDPLHNTRKGRNIRYKILEEVYMIHPKNERLMNAKNILIIDDIKTTGSTVDIMYDLLMDFYPHLEIFFLAIAQTAPRDESGHYLQHLNNKFDPKILI